MGRKQGFSSLIKSVSKIHEKQKAIPKLQFVGNNGKPLTFVGKNKRPIKWVPEKHWPRALQLLNDEHCENETMFQKMTAWRKEGARASAQARREKSAILTIIEAYKKLQQHWRRKGYPKPRAMASIIAQRLGLSPQYVRRVINDNKKATTPGARNRRM
jgi:hypothetical protein